MIDGQASASSVFLEIARQSQIEEMVVIKVWCPFCYADTDHLFNHEDNIFEYYSCAICGNYRPYAVR